MHDTLVGAKILAVREMTQKELDSQYWEVSRVHAAPLVIELDTGAKIFASRDEEGNGPGCLFGSANGIDFYVTPE